MAYLERRLLVAIRAVLLTVVMTIQFGVYGYRFFSGEPMHRAEVVVYVVLAIVGVVVAVVLVARGRLPGPIRWAGAAVVLACSVVMSDVLPLAAVPRAEHWSFSVICWHGLALLFDVALTWFAAFCAVHVTASVLPMVVSGAPVEDLARMAMIGVAVVGFQLGIAVSTVLVRAIAAASAKASGTEERLRIQTESASAAEGNRARRYADLQVATIPLLAGLAGGDLDPRDPDVRRRCALEAARMRRLFCETEAVDDRLVHELGAVIDIAERHGASVQLSVRGSPVEVSRPVRHDLLTPITDVLLASGSDARVTVLYTPGRVQLSVRCAAPAATAVRSGGEKVARIQSIADGQLLLETSWQSP